MSVYYIQPLDPQELASRFSTEDSFEPVPGADAEWKELHMEKIKDVLDRLPDREADLIRLYFFKNKRQTDIAEIFNITQAAVSYRLKRALDRIRFLIEIPEVTKEKLYKDLLPVMPTKLDARIFSEMFESTCQSEVAEILNISQGRVRHRYIANLARMGDVFSDRVYAWVQKQDNAHEVQSISTLLSKYRELRVKSEEVDAKDLEKTLNQIGEHLQKLPEELRDEDLLMFASYYKSFVTIRYNFNILREIKLPKWSERPTLSIS